MINRHFTVNFIKHYLSATRIDVLHSPFVFDLYNSCIKRKPLPVHLQEIEWLRNSARRNNTLITQTDLGALGKKNKLRKKPVSYFASAHAKPKRLAHILHLIIAKFGYSKCIELGTSLGFSSMYMARALPEGGLLLTMEGADEIATLALEHFKKSGTSDKITLASGNFNDLLPQHLALFSQVDFAFIDGNHTREATLNYFSQLLPLMHNDSVLIFDDIYWSSGMTAAWEEIKNHPDVTVTVDLFFIGLVFFRKQQAREHFRLRVL